MLTNLKTVCAWCPPTPEAEEWERQGIPISHGICEACAAKLMKTVQVPVYENIGVNRGV